MTLNVQIAKFNSPNESHLALDLMKGVSRDGGTKKYTNKSSTRKCYSYKVKYGIRDFCL